MADLPTVTTITFPSNSKRTRDLYTFAYNGYTVNTAIIIPTLSSELAAKDFVMTKCIANCTGSGFTNTDFYLRDKLFFSIFAGGATQYFYYNDEKGIRIQPALTTTAVTATCSINNPSWWAQNSFLVQGYFD